MHRAFQRVAALRFTDEWGREAPRGKAIALDLARGVLAGAVGWWGMNHLLRLL